MTTESKWFRAAMELARREDVVVSKFRNSMTGVAYTDDPLRRIEAPAPKSAISFAIFAHEVGHQALHRGNGKTPRWIEEVEAWEFALHELEVLGCTQVAYERVEQKATSSLAYTFHKALRRGASREAIQREAPSWWANAVRVRPALAGH